MRFYLRVHALLQSIENAVVLNLGCGRGSHRQLSTGLFRSMQSFKGKTTRVIGLDVDPLAASNDDLDEFRLMSGSKFPLEDGSLDLRLSDWTVEHLEEVKPFFSECARVIRPRSYLCFRTPNRYHSASVGAAFIPAKHHHTVRRSLGHFHEADDVFPTYYRCNTRGKCRRELLDAGFEPLVSLHQGDSHLFGRGVTMGRIGRWIEGWSPRFLHQEIHAFGRRKDLSGNA